MDPSELSHGQTIADRYRLLALRGSGAMGSVWRAVHVPDQRECAIKLMHRGAAPPAPDRIARFLREARAASSIDSPHAVRVLDYGVAADTPFIAMELLEGETLGSRLRREGRIGPLETSRIVGQIASALDAAHARGIVHRDLKPDNVFLAQEAHGAVAKVLDFGIAKLRDDDSIAPDLTASGALLGTPYYMSPEQIEGARYVDHGADLWSLALIAFECITGERAFKADGLRSLFAAICVQPMPVPSAVAPVPAGFDAWFAKAADRDPKRRFRRAIELARALRTTCDAELALQGTGDEPGDAGRAVAAEVRREPAPTRPRLSRRHAIWAAGGLALITTWLSFQLLAPAGAAPPAKAAAPRPPARESAHPRAQKLAAPAAPALAGSASGETAPAPTPAAPAAPPAAPAVRTKPAPARSLFRERTPAASEPKREGWNVEAMLRDRK